MPTFTNQVASEASKILFRFLVTSPPTYMGRAAAQVGQELSVPSAKPGQAVWLTATHDGHLFTIDVCSDHDDDSGCCDTCGRWVKDAGPDIKQHTYRTPTGIVQVFRSAADHARTTEPAIGAYQLLSDGYRTYNVDGGSLGVYATEAEAFKAVYDNDGSYTRVDRA